MLSLLAATLFAPPDPVQLNVDATDAARGIFHVSEIIPAGGPLVLKYPKWIPGEHGPSGPIFDVVNVHFVQDGKDLEWHHDPIDLFTFRVTSASGKLEAKFDFVAHRREIASRNLARIKWNRLILLPETNAATNVTPTLKAPEGWSVATALDFGHTGKLETVSAERLIDSPAVIGHFYQTMRIDSAGLPPAALEVFTEKPVALDASLVEAHKRLYKEAIGFFGVPHFRHYQFLLTYSDQGGHEGLEHNESSEDGMDFDAIKNSVATSDLDAHEFSHSWCGKYRRPVGLANLNYDVPMNDEDLWAYEGFTQFAGVVLSARCKMWTPEQFRERIATDLDDQEYRSGRNWRTVEDTAIFGSLINTNPDAWLSRRRAWDYYVEMVSVWLEADSIIRRESGGKKSIDDFCHLFFGGVNIGPQIVPYTRDQLYDALGAVQPYDWKGFIRSRVLSLRPHMTDGWLESLGWLLTYDDKPNGFQTAAQVGEKKWGTFSNSLGVIIVEGEVRDVQEGSASDQARVAPGMKVIAVDGEKYSVDACELAIQRHVGNPNPLELLVDDYGVFRTIAIDYHAGLKIPHLKAIEGHSDLLGPLGVPHT